MPRRLSLVALLAVAASAFAQPSPDAVNGMAARGDVAGLRAALDAGADPNGLGKPYALFLQEESTPLFEAINGRHAEAVEVLLEAGANPFEPDEDGRLPMWYAADVGRVDIARLLLEFDADIEDGSDGGTTPLMWAAYGDKTDLVAFLLDRGADIDARDGNNNSVLSKAVQPYGSRLGNARTARLLIARGAALSVPNVRGFTPLHMAVHTSPGGLVLTHLLLEAGADASLPNADGQTPAVLAAQRGGPMLQAYYAGDVTARAQATLLLAVVANDAAGVRASVAAGADPNWGASEDGAEAASDGSALHAAAVFGHADLVPVLIEVGALVDATDDQGFTPLYRAAENGDLATVRALLDAGAAADGTRDWSFLGLEPIHLAALSGNAGVVQALLDAGARLDWTTSATMGDGFNPLGFAIRAGHLDVVRTLLDAGADPNVLGETKTRPLDLAEERGWTAIASLLRERGSQSRAEAAAAYLDDALANGSTPADLFAEAAFADDLDLLGLLIERGHTPPSDALAQAASTEMVAALLQAGAALQGPTASGATPLHEALGGGSEATVRALIEAGADLNARDGDGQTPLHLAILYDRADAVDLLIYAGANVNARNGENQTPLQIARANAMDDYATWLTEAGATD